MEVGVAAVSEPNARLTMNTYLGHTKFLKFIGEHYPWFLRTYDGYCFPIQYADVIRFVLHHYGGTEYDVDIDCKCPLDPLLIYPIHPKTIPVGVSDDLMFSTTRQQNFPRCWTYVPCHTPKSMYRINAEDGEAPHSFFSHFYGSNCSRRLCSWAGVHGVARQAAQTGYALDGMATTDLQSI
ncbi:hypothetical protein IW261DRAFT_206801 [Armillaria novae-zelandiae]|uniref:Glycosyltransferase family 32 protein n=1 Tax=Armillaria novae-zelandiae TaxID=153914 RepID=A0AA39P637_9AGAR|nr:hypothetical protein IW261DRAFT_206801 [Armillaria novae-zelandiae]